MTSQLGATIPCPRCQLEKQAGLEDDGGSACPDCHGTGVIRRVDVEEHAMKTFVVQLNATGELYLVGAKDDGDGVNGVWRVFAAKVLKMPGADDPKADFDTGNVDINIAEVDRRTIGDVQPIFKE